MHPTENSRVALIGMACSAAQRECLKSQGGEGGGEMAWENPWPCSSPAQALLAPDLALSFDFVGPLRGAGSIGQAGRPGSAPGLGFQASFHRLLKTPPPATSPP